MPNQKTISGSNTVVVDNPTKQRFFLVAILFIGIAVAFLDRVNVSVLVANEQFLLDMGIIGQPVKIGMLMSLFLVTYGIANITLSPLGDYIGPRKAMTICILLMIISLFMGGLAGTFTMMLAARIVLGIGEGFYYPMQSLYVKNWFPPKERGRANATWIIGQSLAPALAMPFFAYIIAAYGWRFSFFACVALTLIPMYLFWFHTKDTPREHKKVNAAELQHIEEGLAQELKNKDVLVKESVLSRLKLFVFNYRYWLLVCWYASLQMMYWGLIAWLPTYLKSTKGFSWTEMGWLASLPFIAGMVFKGFSGVICDRLGRSAPVLAMAMLLASICIYTGIIAADKYVAAVLIACGIGFSTMGTPAAWTLLQGLVPGKSLSIAAGTMNGLSTGLSALSPVVIGFFITTTGGMDGALYFIVGIGIAAAGLASILAVQKY